MYDGDVCLGGGTIRERGPTLWEEATGLKTIGWGSQLMHLRG